MRWWEVTGEVMGAEEIGGQGLMLMDEEDVMIKWAVSCYCTPIGGYATQRTWETWQENGTIPYDMVNKVMFKILLCFHRDVLTNFARITRTTKEILWTFCGFYDQVFTVINKPLWRF
jgi:hypothetical protein